MTTQNRYKTITSTRKRQSLYRLASVVLASLMLLPFSTNQAAELYKIVDDEGNVTFSQFPPSKPRGQVENVKVAGTGDAMTTVSQTGNVEYCGDIELPTKDYYRSHQHPNDRFLREVGNKRKSWQRQLEHAEKQINEATRSQHARNTNYNPYYRDSSYRSKQDVAHFERQEAQLKTIRDLRCAVHWADQRDADMEQFREQNHAELKRLEDVQQNLLSQQQRNCGNEPPLDPSSEGAKLRRQQWSDCSQQYQRDLRDVSRQLHAVSQKIGATLP